MKVLDLFSGLEGWSQAFRDRCHRVVTVDIEKKFKPTIIADVSSLTPKDFSEYGQFDLVLASPPCNCFSVASVYRHWDKNRRPKDAETFKAIDLVADTISLILKLHPRWWILENPRGMLRLVLGKPSVTTYFASWGHWALKPTDLWGVLPSGIKWAKPKKWQKAPRGSKKGIQGFVRLPELRAKIPYGLSEVICLACEKELKEFLDA